MLPKAHLTKITTLLQTLGLNESETHVYVTGLFTWPITIAQLAIQAELKRVTVHAIVDRLITLWLYTDTRRAKKRLVSPAPPEAIEALIAQKQVSLDQLSSHYTSTLPLFSQISSLTWNFPRVRLLQWTEWVTTTLLEQARDWVDVFALYDAHSLEQIVWEKTLHRSYQQRHKHTVKTRMVLPDGFTDRRYVERWDDVDIHIKTLPAKQIVDGGIEIWGNKVAMHCRKEWYITTTILENQEIAQIQHSLRNALRAQATDYQGSFVIV